MLRLSKKADYALMAMKHLAIAAILAECSIAEMAADPDPSAPPVTLMSSPVVRRAPALSATSREP